ncbi:FabA-like domain protein [Fictibacillus sp. KIGAM418]|uniref:FabA-like domain protein n=1 Tax=Fictibacillus marinisediminis TaxID=2878389 RepID=A0A9X1XER3_9BACL|nr:FabA-like domain protein [Fictibacillus marinisediminis]MCK6259459.1 FabA-like domain protein [Fictibacillus marinisediminis]
MDYLRLLPHEYPLRLVDKVELYRKGEILVSKFDTNRLNWLPNQTPIPESILMEGMAQSAVIFTQLETRPLQKDEFPVLGAINATILSRVEPGQLITYKIKPLRLLQDQAVIEGSILVHQQTVLRGTLTVGIS